MKVLYGSPWRRRLIEGEGGHAGGSGRGCWSGPLVRWLMQVSLVSSAREAAAAAQQKYIMIVHGKTL